MRHFYAALGGLALLAGACGGGGTHPETSPSTGTLPPPASSSTTTPPPASTTTTTIDTSAVPAVITPAYVDAVFVQLDQVLGDAVRSVVANRRLTPTAIRLLGEIYGPKQLAVELKIFPTEIKLGFTDIRHPPGDERVTVLRLITVSRSCVYFQGKTGRGPPVVATGRSQ